MRKAREIGLDLVEIAPKAKPPVAKIIDFKKFKYLEAKREREIRKKAKVVKIKEFHVRPFIDRHDLSIRAVQAADFLKEGKRIKIVVKFQGREFGKKDFGYALLNKFSDLLIEHAQVEGAPRWEGRFLTLILNPKKTYGQNKKNQSTQDEKSSSQAIQDN